MNLSTTQKNEFLARLARIEAGTGSSKSTLYVGDKNAVLAGSRASAKLKKQAAAAPSKPLGLFSALLSVAVGAIALGLALYLRFSVTGDAGPLDNSDPTMMINGGIALAIALFFGFMVKMPLLKYTPVSAAGILAAVVGYHNLVHVYPTQFADMFSAGWVEQVVAATPAHSIIWRGQTFVL